MPTLTTEREPLVRKPADGPTASHNGCNCRARALDALGELADLTLALGIHDAEVWRGIGILHSLLTQSPDRHHPHILGNVH